MMARLLPSGLAVFLAVCTLTAGCTTARTDVSRVAGGLRRRVGVTVTNPPPGSTTLPSGVSLQDGVAENEAVLIALWNNPVFQENLTKLGVARADVVQAGLLANPTFSMLFPWGPKQLEFAATFPLEAIWLQPRRVAIARIDMERTAESLVQSGLDLVRDVRIGFSDLQLARDRARLAREAILLRERIAEITEGRQRGGEGSELETSSARVEVERTRDDLRRATHDATAVELRLLTLLGWTKVTTNLNFLPAESPKKADISLTELEKHALASRPDLRASELAMEAAAKRAGLAKAEILMLSGIIDANAEGKKGFEIGPGAQLAIPIFNQNQGGRTRAHAEVERSAWNYAGTRQRILLEVRESHTRYQLAAEALENWTTQLLPSLEELVRRSERAYELGELSPLAIQENARQLLAARLRHAELLADLRRASAELERAVSTRWNDSQKDSRQP